MYLKLLDLDKFIEKHKIIEVKNANYPTSKGYDAQSLWSEVIFGGQNSNNRLRKFGFINLHTQVINPILYNIIRTSSPIVRNILFGKDKYVFKDEKFKQSDDGETELSFLIKNIGQFKFSDICKPEKKEEAAYLDSLPVNQIVIDKILVIPAGLRDISPTAKRMFTTEINEHYSYLLFLTNQLILELESTNKAVFTENIQKTIIKIQTWIENQMKGKRGIFRSTILKKVVDNSARLVAIGSSKMPLGKIGIPWHSLLILYEPFFLNAVFYKDPILQERIAVYLNKEINELELNDVKKLILSFVKTSKTIPEDLKDLLIQTAKDITKDKQILCKRDPVVSRTSYYAAEIEVLSEGKSAVVSTMSCEQQGLDFDGDQVALLPMFTKEANEQAKKLNPVKSKTAWARPITYNSNNYQLTLDAVATIFNTTAK